MLAVDYKMSTTQYKCLHTQSQDVCIVGTSQAICLPMTTPRLYNIWLVLKVEYHCSVLMLVVVEMDAAWA